MLIVDGTKGLFDLIYVEVYIYQGIFFLKVIFYDFCSIEENSSLFIIDSKQESEKELCIKNFYKGVVEYIGCEFVSVVIEGGFRDSIIVMVMFFNGSEYYRLI